MNLKEKLEASLKESMKLKDETRKKTIRLALSSITLAEKEHGKMLDDQSIISILQKEIKIRKDSITESQTANRSDLLEEYNNEIKILSTFLPEQMNEVEIRKIVIQEISKIGASTMADMGKVMKSVIPLIKGRAPNNLVSQIVREQLSK